MGHSVEDQLAMYIDDTQSQTLPKTVGPIVRELPFSVALQHVFSNVFILVALLQNAL